MKTVTITDIAKASGVSIKTVSRVLNNQANVRDEKRELVRRTAKELGYRANLSARMLRSQKSCVIVHFHDNPNSDYLENIYKGVSRTARASGYFAVMESLSPPYSDQARAYFNEFLVDGVILSPPLSDDPALLSALQELEIPFVRLSPRRDVELSSSSFIDEAKAAEGMTFLLTKLGHQKIAFIGGLVEHEASLLRQRGFENAIASAGLSLEDCPVLKGDFSFRSGFELCTELLSDGLKVTAIFAANDNMAIGAVMAAFKAGVDVPSDLSIAGFDGSRLGEVIWPQLTTVLQPVEDMAVDVTAHLISELVQPDVEKASSMFEVDLLVRGTTAKAPE